MSRFVKRIYHLLILGCRSFNYCSDGPINLRLSVLAS